MTCPECRGKGYLVGGETCPLCLGKRAIPMEEYAGLNQGGQGNEHRS